MEPYPNQIYQIQTIRYEIGPTLWYFLWLIKPYLHRLLKVLFVSILHLISNKIFENNSLKVTTSISITYHVTYIQSSTTIGLFHHISAIWKFFGMKFKIFVPPLLALSISPAFATLWKNFTHTNTWSMWDASSRVWMITTTTFVLSFCFLILSLTSIEFTL